MVKGRIDKKASTATGYGWLIWKLDTKSSKPALDWIPPCRKSLEKDGDYDDPVLRKQHQRLKNLNPAAQLNLI